jgi:Zn-dependent protease with chaperone function
MRNKLALVDVRKNLRMALFKSLLVPLLTLAFFMAAPNWLNTKLRDQITAAIDANPNLSPAERSQRTEKTATLDLQQICLDCPPGMEKLHDNLERAGVVGNFQRLRWGLWLSLVLVGGLAIAVCAIYALNKTAAQSPDALLRGYRLSWHIAMAAALAKVFLLIPLLAYGTFEFTVLLSNQYYPKVLLLIVLGGGFALWRSAAILMKTIPLEFNEPMSREVTSVDAPELWQAVRSAAERLQTTPPDHILIGLQLNFYVTELAVKHDAGRAAGRTLYISYPLLKQLSVDEVLAIIGHELGHFIGEDTKMTRQFYPLRLKVQGTMFAMAHSGWMGWPSFQFLSFFNWCFSQTEQAASRSRELLADQKGAALTSAQTAAQALVRFQVAAEAFQRGLKEALKNKAQSPLDIPLQTVVEEKLAPDTAFWTQLFEKKLPHPLDSHPSLQIRLESLGQPLSVEDARRIALIKLESAYDKWFSTRAALFTNLAKQAEAAVERMRFRVEVVDADYTTESGKQLLDQLFPERKWQARPSAFWKVAVLLGFFGLICLAGVMFANDLTAKMIYGFVAVFLGLGIAVAFKRHSKSELVLTADGLRYTRWKRPLRFQEVEKISAQRAYSNLTLIFHLKTKQPPFRNFSIFRSPVKRASLSLNGLEGKPVATAQTIFKYFTRQAEAKDPAVQR